MKSVLMATVVTAFLVGCAEEAQNNPSDPVGPLRDNFTVTDLNLTMIWVNPGTFTMGSPETEVGRFESEIQRQVTLSAGFYLGKREVTQAQWERVMGTNPSKFKEADRPVEMVSWNEAVEFCNKLSQMEGKADRLPEGMKYQLPTEAQWEYACRAGTVTAYSFGNSMSPKSLAERPANPWGFHDMHGGVWEWCQDRYELYYTKAPQVDPTGPSSGSSRVKRGGSSNDTPASMRSAERSEGLQNSAFSSLGFRISLRTTPSNGGTGP